MSYKKKFFKYLTYIILFTFSLSLKAEIIDKIVINGNKRVSDQTIILYGKFNVKDDLNEQKLNDIINNLNSTNFFEDINVKIKDNILTIDLKEYPIINQIIIRGEPSKKISEEIRKNLRLKEKNSFIKSYLADDIDIIKKLYSSVGYSFVKVETKVNKINNENFDLLIDINREKNKNFKY